MKGNLREGVAGAVEREWCSMVVMLWKGASASSQSWPHRGLRLLPAAGTLGMVRRSISRGSAKYGEGRNAGSSWQGRKRINGEAAGCCSDQGC
jgi:hypothetical protein